MGKATGKPRGRPKGAKTLSTIQRERRMQETAEKVAAALGTELFDGDAHTLLMLTYKNTSLPLDVRIDAAKAAIPYEKHRLAAIEHSGSISNHEAALEDLDEDGGDAQ